MKITKTTEIMYVKYCRNYVCVKNYFYLAELPKGPMATDALNIPTVIRHDLTSYSVVSFPLYMRSTSIFKFI